MRPRITAFVFLAALFFTMMDRPRLQAQTQGGDVFAVQSINQMGGDRYDVKLENQRTHYVHSITISITIMINLNLNIGDQVRETKSNGGVTLAKLPSQGGGSGGGGGQGGGSGGSGPIPGGVQRLDIPADVNTQEGLVNWCKWYLCFARELKKTLDEKAIAELKKRPDGDLAAFDRFKHPLTATLAYDIVRESSAYGPAYRIRNIKITHNSGLAEFDAVCTEAVTSMEGGTATPFPDGSTQDTVHRESTFNRNVKGSAAITYDPRCADVVKQYPNPCGR